MSETKTDPCKPEEGSLWWEFERALKYHDSHVWWRTYRAALTAERAAHAAQLAAKDEEIRELKAGARRACEMMSVYGGRALNAEAVLAEKDTEIARLKADVEWRHRWHDRLGRGEAESEGQFYERLESAYARGEAAGLKAGFIAGKQARWLAPGWAGRRFGRFDFSGSYRGEGVFDVPLSEELISAFLAQRTEAKPCAGCGSEGDACAKWRNDGKICCPDCDHCKVTRTEAPR